MFFKIVKINIFFTLFFPLFLNAAEPYKLTEAVPPISDFWGGIDPINISAPIPPSRWAKNEIKNYYYIDNSDVNATDTNNEFGYPAKPRKTIPERTYDEGAYIEIHGGPYTGGKQIVFQANGTADNPVWFRGPSIDEPALIRGETIVKGSYVFLENLKYDTNKKTIGFRVYGDSHLHHAVIRNSTFVGEGDAVGATSVISIYGSTNNRFHDFLVYGNTISNFGDSEKYGEDDYVGVMPRINVDRVWIVNNHIYDVGGDSVLVGIASTNDVNRVSGIYIADNELHGNGENAIDVKESDNVIIANNLLYDVKRSGSSAGEVVVVHDNPTYVTIVNNRIHSGENGVVVTSGENIWLIGNVIYNIHHGNSETWEPASLYSSGAAIHFRGTGRAGILDNTILDYDIGLQLASGRSGYDVKNNVFAFRAALDGYEISSGSSTNDKKSFLAANLFYTKGVDAAFLWKGGDIGGDKFSDCLQCVYNIDPKQNLKILSAEELNLVILFSDGKPPSESFSSTYSLISVPDYSVVANSGSDVSTIMNELEAKYGISLGLDLFGNTRPFLSPSTTVYDIGAFETKSGSGESVKTPSSPTMVEVMVLGDGK
ncbi:right-handed parallel beta-helix repeat-containing protein [Moritella sp. 28]|uniref:right-handed parallel beta-helix repeat-containing protein n=1 Tax=Moritella sp. 28 TaxID=2746232 RepID=UPI001BAA90BE|nr:right-handed parallel beta-helix repeat-containing protein [Moritella sp. 28]QUM85339.1 right-handed parallel beta-helix repeat-containing protein [Moritella sp. 28]